MILLTIVAITLIIFILLFAFSWLRQQSKQQDLQTLKILQDTIREGAQESRQQIKEALTEYATQVGHRVEQLTLTTDTRLKEINQQVEKRLTSGFEKTTETFHDVLKRLALIDAAQKKLTELSNNVISLQEILTDKRSRGAFGEVQLAALVRNMLPEQHFSFQYTLSNGKRLIVFYFYQTPAVI